MAGLILAALLLSSSVAGNAWASALQADQGNRQQCFQETGKCVRGAFLIFWEQHGGLPLFGYPISDEIMERNAPPPAGDGQEHLVQYFQRARFEFHDNPGKSHGNVKLGLLGREQWQARYPDATPPAVQPQSTSDPFEFCARARTVDYPAWHFQGAVVFTGAVRDPVADAAAGLRCQNGQPLICTPGASDWICSKVNPSMTPPERTMLYCQIRGGTGPVPAAYVDRTSIYLWTCQNGRATIERQVVTDDQVDDRGYRVDAWRPLTGGHAQPSVPALVGPLWSWQETNMSDETTITVSDPPRYTIVFQADGAVAIQADCNRAAGRYTISGSQLTIILGPTTAVACSSGSQDQIYLRQLGQIASFVIKDHDLYLSLRLDSGIMRFAPITPADPADGVVAEFMR